MLSMAPTNDKNLLNNLSESIFSCDFEGDVGYIFSNGDKIVGFAKISCNEEVSTLLKLGILPVYRRQKLGDFFTRSILLRMSSVSEKIQINYKNEYFKKFGFIEKEGKMVIDSDKLFFPCECKKGV